ncbi:hypothetical protein CYMTET_33236 [Cymbomonas tetramitiformis]|uniref:Uncharacterized protein n=1 Tax=Cymbomonas tetramitiformis TaxID=36881 RepID=A0AAE0KRE5_9CHLO|nr:hypothetical protein CYMTET_33236 [Cymbomonas tetramitiformis]
MGENQRERGGTIYGKRRESKYYDTSFKRVGRALLDETEQANFGFLERMWYGTVKPALVFPTSKVVVIADWRIALLNRGLQIVVLGYLLFNLLEQQTFLLLDVPTNVLTMYSSTGNLTSVQRTVWKQLQDRNHDHEESAYPYCWSGSSYDYVWSDDWVFLHHGCLAGLDGMAATKEGHASFFFTTMEQQKGYVIIERQVDADDCKGVLSASDFHIKNATCAINNADTEDEADNEKIEETVGDERGELDQHGTTSCLCTYQKGFFQVGKLPGTFVLLSARKCFPPSDLFTALPNSHVCVLMSAEFS